MRNIYTHTINDETYTGEKFHGVHWILSYCRENFYDFAFEKNENTFAYNLGLKMALIKLVGGL